MRVLGRPLRFALAGAWNTAFALALFTVLQLEFGDRVGYVVILGIVQVVAVIQSHAVQRMVVWRSRQPYLGELLRFSTIYGVSFAVNALLLVVLVEIAHAPVLATQYIVGGVLIIVTYFAQRRWAFRASGSQASSLQDQRA